MTWSHNLSMAAVVLLAAGCSSSGAINVETDASPSANFAEYKTFAFGRIPESEGKTDNLDDINRERVENAIYGSLAAKGMRRVADPTQADLVIYTFASGKDRMELTTYGGGYTYAGPRWGGMYSTTPTTTQVNTIREGTLVVDMADPKKKQVVWRGIASSEVTDRKDAEKKIPQAISKMMEKFPVQGGAPPGGN